MISFELVIDDGCIAIAAPCSLHQLVSYTEGNRMPIQALYFTFVNTIIQSNKLFLIIFAKLKIFIYEIWISRQNGLNLKFN